MKSGIPHARRCPLNRSGRAAADHEGEDLQSFARRDSEAAKLHDGGPGAAAHPEESVMNRIQRRFARVLIFFSFALLGLARAQAEPVSAEDSKAVRAVIEAQLGAFAADDAKRAFSYASPSIREMFKTPDRFMEMVRTGYPVIYRSTAVIFLNPLWIEGQLVEGVQLTDADGSLWLATYRLERQPDRSWRISGCDVQPSAGKMT
jgi:hypothetical protein